MVGTKWMCGCYSVSLGEVIRCWHSVFVAALARKHDATPHAAQIIALAVCGVTICIVSWQTQKTKKEGKKKPSLDNPRISPLKCNLHLPWEMYPNQFPNNLLFYFWVVRNGKNIQVLISQSHIWAQKAKALWTLLNSLHSKNALNIQPRA